MLGGQTLLTSRQRAGTRQKGCGGFPSCRRSQQTRPVPSPSLRTARCDRVAPRVPSAFPDSGVTAQGGSLRPSTGSVSHSRWEREVVPVPRPSGPSHAAPGAASETFCPRSPREDGAGSRGPPWTLPAGWDEPTLSFGESREEPSSPVDTRETGCWLLRLAFRVLHFPDPPKSHLVGRRIKISGSRPVSLCGACWEHGQHLGSGRLTLATDPQPLWPCVAHAQPGCGRPAPINGLPFSKTERPGPEGLGGIWSRWAEARRVDDKLMQKGDLQGQDPRGVGAAPKPPLSGDPRPDQRNWHFLSPSAPDQAPGKLGARPSLGDLSVPSPTHVLCRCPAVPTGRQTDLVTVPVARGQAPRALKSCWLGGPGRRWCPGASRPVRGP